MRREARSATSPALGRAADPSLKDLSKAAAQRPLRPLRAQRCNDS